MLRSNPLRGRHGLQPEAKKIVDDLIGNFAVGLVTFLKMDYVPAEFTGPKLEHIADEMYNLLYDNIPKTRKAEHLPRPIPRLAGPGPRPYEKWTSKAS